MQEIVERILAPLVGLTMWGPARSTDLLVVHFGERRTVDGRAVGAFTLEIACAWRVASTAILMASGDLFTPADPDADLERFDWDVDGASWWDIRIQEVTRLLHEAPAPVTTFVADSFGGFRLVCSGGVELEVFPNSSAAPHVETEFWTLSQLGQSVPRVVVGTNGVELVHETAAESGIRAEGAV